MVNIEKRVDSATQEPYNQKSGWRGSKTPMISDPLSLRPYVNEHLLRAAQKGLERIGNDLVIYLDEENGAELLVTDRNKFLSVMSCGDTVRQALDEPARVKASKKMLLNKDAVVFWFVVASPNGVQVQVLTLNNQYKLTTHIIGLA